MGEDGKTVSSDLQSITVAVTEAVHNRATNGIAILEVLRLLERLHQDLRDTYFHALLPTTRHDLYSLLQNIEESGGWPYIPRMTIQNLLEHLTTDDES